MTDDETRLEPSPAEGSSAFDRLAKEIARLDLMQAFDFLPHNAKLYKVEKSWKTSIIMDDPKVRGVETLLEFERAVCDPDVIIVYVPATALISEEGIHRICKRNATGKTILKEVTSDEF